MLLIMIVLSRCCRRPARRGDLFVFLSVFSDVRPAAARSGSAWRSGPTLPTNTGFSGGMVGVHVGWLALVGVHPGKGSSKGSLRGEASPLSFTCTPILVGVYAGVTLRR